jgi:hypothetical protein
MIQLGIHSLATLSFALSNCTTYEVRVPTIRATMTGPNSAGRERNGPRSQYCRAVAPMTQVNEAGSLHLLVARLKEESSLIEANISTL